jgi:hypothetical protein
MANALGGGGGQLLNVMSLCTYSIVKLMQGNSYFGDKQLLYIGSANGIVGRQHQKCKFEYILAM